jgi:long-chain acyl-CoA synthetase
VSRETLLDFFQDFSTVEAEFLIYDDGFRSRSYKYSEVAGLASGFAERLRAAGISKDQKVILYSENRPEWIVALWGCLLAGVVAVPIDFRSSPEFVQRIHEIVDAKAILVGDEVETPGWKMAELGATSGGSLNKPDQRITRDDTAEIIFTSGATAEPKGVVITHRNVLANIVPVESEVRKYLKWSRPFAPIRFLNLLPLSHMFGQAMATFIPPMLPGVVVFMRGFSPAEIVRQIHNRRISVLVCVPKILDVLQEYLKARFPELGRPDDRKMHWMLRWWRYRKIHNLFGWKFWSFIVGAAPLPAESEAFWSRLGFLVIQGYGLTETAPIVTLNHPFHARKGSVGKPIGGVEVKIADDGEILVRGENVTSGYFNAPAATAQAFAGGWFHTGDVGDLDENGQLRILGRKKEMIVTPEGLNVFPEDVERVLNHTPGVRDSAAIGTDRVHAVLILEPGANQDEIVREANSQLADYQRIRTASIWPYPEFPRTEGTGKLKRHEIAKGTAPVRHTGKVDLSVPLESLTSLERVERMVALGMDESEFSSTSQPIAVTEPPIEFPRWNRSWIARLVRRVALTAFLLPLLRVFAHIRVEGLENLAALQPPVLFAPTHQSYLDVPAIQAALPSRWRFCVAPAMSKEFFREHFHGHSFTNSLNYYLACLLFNCFPIPQREAGALDTMRYMGELTAEGSCVLIFPEGRMTDRGEVAPFQPGVGMLGSKLDVPVVPVKLLGLDKVLHRTWTMARPGRVVIRFGPALRLHGDDYQALAKQVEEAVRKL